IRAGQTEASVDMAAVAGLNPAGVICEIMKEDGTMARVPDLIEFAERHDIKIITVAELIRYRLRTERFIHKHGETTLPTPHGDFRMFVFESIFDQQTHIALVRGNIENGEDVLVRVQTHCLTGHVFGSPACRCHDQMDRAMEMIAQAGRGVLLYLHQMGRSWSGTTLLEYHGKHGADSN